MGIVIDATERFAERRRLADQARGSGGVWVENETPPDKHQLALRELLGEIDGEEYE